MCSSSHRLNLHRFIVPVYGAVVLRLLLLLTHLVESIDKKERFSLVCVAEGLNNILESVLGHIRIESECSPSNMSFGFEDHHRSRSGIPW